MNHIPGLDKWLTTPPEDNNPSSTKWMDKVCEGINDKFYAYYEEQICSYLQDMYERGMSVNAAISYLYVTERSMFYEKHYSSDMLKEDLEKLWDETHDISGGLK